jgi:hypothetical protein
VDWEGNVYMIERDAHRIVKMNPKMDTVLLQLGTTMEKGNDEKHFDLPSGIAVLRNGNIVVTDGYGNNRVVMFDKTGKFIKQVAKGAGGPADKGNGPGEWVLPHKLAVDAHHHPDGLAGRPRGRCVGARRSHRLPARDRGSRSGRATRAGARACRVAEDPASRGRPGGRRRRPDP